MVKNNAINLTNEIKNLELETLENIKHSRAFNTSRAYKSDFRDFVIFCNNLNISMND